MSTENTLLGTLNKRDSAAGMTMPEKRRRALGMAARVAGTVATAALVLTAAVETHDHLHQEGPVTNVVPAVQVEHNRNQTEQLLQHEAEMAAQVNQHNDAP